MITETKGDLLKADADVICHQVNYYGVMGGGIAYAIQQIMSKTSYNKYAQHCKKKGRDLLGHVCYTPRCDTKGRRYIANLFSQDDFDTSYKHLRICLENVERTARKRGLSVALPGNMGCGIANGNWSEVIGIIRDVFSDSPVPLTIVYRDK